MGNEGETAGIGENHGATQPRQLIMREDAAAAARRQKYWEEPPESSLKRKPVAWGEQETPQHLQAPWGTGQRMEVREAQPLCWHGCPVDPQHGVLGALGALGGAGSCPPGIADEPRFGGEVPAAYQHRLSFNI